MKSSIFGGITPCNPVKDNRRFGGTYRLHLQARTVSMEGNQHEAGSKQRHCKRPNTALHSIAACSQWLSLRKGTNQLDDEKGHYVMPWKGPLVPPANPRKWGKTCARASACVRALCIERWLGKKLCTRVVGMRFALIAWFMLVFCMAYSSTLEMEVTCSSETSTSTWLPGVISQKTGLPIATGVQTQSNILKHFNVQINLSLRLIS
jgi:hypothetical protein